MSSATPSRAVPQAHRLLDPKAVYTDRVERYVHGRPRYPTAVLDLLGRSGVDGTWVVADIGSGTGILSELLLANGNRVFAVEPNPAMRAAAEHLLGRHPRFVGLAGTAEATGIAGQSVDLVAVGQALHWFDLARARREFTRILRPGGLVVLLWNEQAVDRSPLAAELDALLRAELPAYVAAAEQAPRVEALAEGFFRPSPWTCTRVENRQSLTEPALLDRVLSCSYAPSSADPASGRLVTALADLHRRHADDGGLAHLDYDTWVVHGRLDEPGPTAVSGADDRRPGDEELPDAHH